MSQTIRVAVVGAGMAGQAHAFGYRNVSMATRLSSLKIELADIVDPNAKLAASVAARYGFARYDADLGAVLMDDDIDVISVAVPNAQHLELLPRILASGKHVFAEKPVGRSAPEAAVILDHARNSPGVCGVGLSWRRVPGLSAVAEAVAEGVAGTPFTVGAHFYADYALDPRSPLTWRYSQREAGGGALIDIGSHALDSLRFIAGPITSVLSATLRTVITERPLPQGDSIGHGGAGRPDTSGPVTNDDIALLTVEMASGAVGAVETSRVAAGRPNSLGVEVFGSAGHVSFESIRSGEFQLFQTAAATQGRNGPRTVYTGPQHPYFADVAPMPAAGLGTGYGEAFIAELQQFLTSVLTQTPMDTSFDEAYETMLAIEAAMRSAQRGAAVRLDDIRAELSPPGR